MTQRANDVVCQTGTSITKSGGAMRMHDTAQGGYNLTNNTQRTINMLTTCTAGWGGGGGGEPRRTTHTTIARRHILTNTGGAKQNNRHEAQSY